MRVRQAVPRGFAASLALKLVKKSLKPPSYKGYQNVILFAHAIITSTASASFLSLSSFSVNLLVFYHKCRSLIGYPTHYIFCDRQKI